MLTVPQLLWNPVDKSYANIRSAAFRLRAQTSCNMALVFLNIDGKSSPISLCLIYSILLVLEH